MTSIVIATIAYFILGAVFLLDKYIVSQKNKAGHPLVYGFYSTVITVLCLALLPFDLTPLSIPHLGIATISGVSFGIALITMFYALRYGEASHMSPFVGGFTALFILLLSNVFLNEHFSLFQSIGIFLLLISMFLFSFEKTENEKKWHMGFLYAIISGFFFATAQTTSKYLYDLYAFLPAFIATKSTTAIPGFALLLFPNFRKLLRQTTSTQKKQKQKTQNKKIFFLFATDKILGLVGVVLLQIAIALGAVSLVGALQGFQFAFIFIAVWIFSKYKPKILHEYMDKKEVALQIIATLFIIVGFVFLVL